MLAVFRLNERGLANRSARRDDAGAGLFLAEGDLVVERALDAGCEPYAALADGVRVPDVAARIADRGVDVYVGGDDVRRMVTGLGMPHPIVALFHRPARPAAADLIASSERLVVVEGVDNPANVGAVVRNASGLGWDGLLLDHTSADGTRRYPTGGNEPILTTSGERIVDAHGRVSRVTTAGAAPSLGSYLLMAYLPPDHAVEDNELRVMYMNELFPVRVARVGATPLFDPDDTRMKS